MAVTAGAFPRAAIPERTFRLIPSRFPPIPAFDAVASAADLSAVMELEGWTNDRLVKERLTRLPTSQWIYGAPNSSVVMASFLHAAPTGLRFTSGALGAWYAGLSIDTSIAEVSHHLRREMAFAAMPRMTAQYRVYTANVRGQYVDIRGARAAHPALYDSSDYSASQGFGENVRASADDGILFDSLRHTGGVNVVAYRPRNIVNVVQAEHLELLVTAAKRVAVRRLP